jgi:hypothetical protein
MVLFLGPETVIVGNLNKEKRIFVHRYPVVVHSTPLVLQSSVLREKSNLKKRGKILKEVKLYALIE